MTNSKLEESINNILASVANITEQVAQINKEVQATKPVQTGQKQEEVRAEEKSNGSGNFDPLDQQAKKKKKRFFSFFPKSKKKENDDIFGELDDNFSEVDTDEDDVLSPKKKAKGKSSYYMYLFAAAVVALMVFSFVRVSNKNNQTAPKLTMFDQTTAQQASLPQNQDQKEDSSPNASYQRPQLSDAKVSKQPIALPENSTTAEPEDKSVFDESKINDISKKEIQALKNSQQAENQVSPVSETNNTIDKKSSTVAAKEDLGKKETTVAQQEEAVNATAKQPAMAKQKTKKERVKVSSASDLKECKKLFTSIDVAKQTLIFNTDTYSLHENIGSFEIVKIAENHIRFYDTKNDYYYTLKIGD